LSKKIRARAILQLVEFSAQQRADAANRCKRLSNPNFVMWASECRQPNSVKTFLQVKASPPAMTKGPAGAVAPAGRRKKDRAVRIAVTRFQKLFDQAEVGDPETRSAESDYSPRRTPTGDGPRSHPTGGIAKGW